MLKVSLLSKGYRSFDSYHWREPIRDVVFFPSLIFFFFKPIFLCITMAKINTVVLSLEPNARMKWVTYNIPHYAGFTASACPSQLKIVKLKIYVRHRFVFASNNEETT